MRCDGRRRGWTGPGGSVRWCGVASGGCDEPAGRSGRGAPGHDATAQPGGVAPVDLDVLRATDHPARTVWAFVLTMDLAPLYARIKSVAGRGGALAIDPAMLVALWPWATIGLNRRLATLNAVAQDGLRVRAHAKALSFRRREQRLAAGRGGHGQAAVQVPGRAEEARAVQAPRQPRDVRPRRPRRCQPQPGHRLPAPEGHRLPRPGSVARLHAQRLRQGAVHPARATVECANAQLRRRGLHRFNVCGMVKARAVLLWHALAHNLSACAALALRWPLEPGRSTGRLAHRRPAHARGASQGTRLPAAALATGLGVSFTARQASPKARAKAPSTVALAPSARRVASAGASSPAARIASSVARCALTSGQRTSPRLA